MLAHYHCGKYACSLYIYIYIYIRIYIYIYRLSACIRLHTSAYVSIRLRRKAREIACILSLTSGASFVLSACQTGASRKQLSAASKAYQQLVKLASELIVTFRVSFVLSACHAGMEVCVCVCACVHVCVFVCMCVCAVHVGCCELGVCGGAADWLLESRKQDTNARTIHWRVRGQQPACAAALLLLRRL